MPQEVALEKEGEKKKKDKKKLVWEVLELADEETEAHRDEIAYLWSPGQLADGSGRTTST